jgi:hypothetical protein
MALIPLNTFKTKTAYLTTSSNTNVYVAPVGTTAIVLMAQIANLGTQTETVSFIHHRNRQVLQDAQGNGAQPANFDTYLLKDYQIPNNDAVNPIGGKLVVEELDSVRCYGSNTQTLMVTLSVLEAANA